MKKKTNSLKKEIWKYFLFFTLINITILLILQIICLNQYYKLTVKNEINHATKVLINNKNNKNMKKLIDDLSIHKEICINIVDKKGNILETSKFYGKSCIRNKNIRENIQNSFINSNKKTKTYEFTDPHTKDKKYISAIKLNNNYAFIKASLRPMDTTARILQSQFIIITIFLLILAAISSYFIFRKIALPITQISEDAQDIANGNYDKQINIDSNIKEIYTFQEILNKAKRELRKTTELQRDLMANVSHDMKTPLTMIKAYAEMMLDLHKNSSKKREEDGKIIIEEVDRLTLLVNDILSLSKMQSNLDQLDKEDIEIVSLIESIINRFKVLSEKEEYNFIFKHNVNELIINVDKKKLEQVIYNLISNAINYVGDDKQIIIELIDDEDAIVKISDHGKGIKKEDLPYIWDKYYKSNKIHKRNKLGTGLGLSIVKNTLQKHNYEFGVDSKEGKGSTFWFKLKK